MSFDLDPRDIIKKDKLGSGNFGKVYSAVVHGTEVAVKVPKVQDLRDEDLESLIDEVRIWSACPHPNIVQLLGACMRKGNFQIVTEKLDGDLETLIHGDKPLSLFIRMCMAREIALGINWLHNIKPAIIHRDLKLGNVLYRKKGNYYEIKVADFGLAQLKPKHVLHLRDPKNGAIGTPLYMAPEIMLGKPFNEKADVYSFGICLWEMLVREDPYQQFDKFETFVHAVAVEGERPAIPSTCPNKLRKLIESCWHRDPERRPTFSMIAQKMIQVIVHSVIDDPEGRSFWIENFSSQLRVPWPNFVNAFYIFIGLSQLPLRNATRGSVYVALNALDSRALRRRSGSRVTSGTPGMETDPRIMSPRRKEEKSDAGEDDDVDITERDAEELVRYRCLRAVLARQENEDNVESVSINHFGDILKWFGPLKLGSNSVLIAIRSMLVHPWFHGSIDSEEAKRRLRNMPSGTFLIRFSDTVPGSFTMSRMVSAHKVSNSRMQYVPGKGFTLESKRFFDTLPHLLASIKEPLELKAACGGSQYTDIFKVLAIAKKGTNDDSESDSDGDDAYAEFGSAIMAKAIYTSTPGGPPLSASAPAANANAIASSYVDIEDDSPATGGSEIQRKVGLGGGGGGGGGAKTDPTPTKTRKKDKEKERERERDKDKEGKKEKGKDKKKKKERKERKKES